MPTYNIRGIDVDFPFEAYDCQLVYMDRVIQSLQQRSNALIDDEKKPLTGKRDSMLYQDSNIIDLTLKRESMQSQDRNLIDLTCGSMLEDKWSEETPTLCSAKKCKVSAEHDVAQHISSSLKKSSHTETFESHGLSSIKSESSHPSKPSHKESTQNAQGGSKLSDKDNVPAPSGDDEMKGSQFLVQVKEKLSALEYKAFVNLMKALKSKAMNINEVLQSTTRFFCGPERLPLLRRFKFIMAKYHSMYDHYFQTNG